MEGRDSSEGEDSVYCAVVVRQQATQRVVGAAVRMKCPSTSTSLEDETSPKWTLTLYDFHDNDQFSNLDSFLLRLGQRCTLFLPSELEPAEGASDRSDGRKIAALMEAGDHTVVYIKRSAISKIDTSDAIRRLCGEQEAAKAEMSRPLACTCVAYLCHSLHLLEDSSSASCHSLHCGSLSNYLMLDSRAAEALSLLPPKQSSSAYDSIFSVLNRCRTKMGQRLLERWLRQPLVSAAEINRRLDVVQVLRDAASARNRLETCLKSIPDAEAAMSRLQKPSAGLGEVYRLCQLAKAVPNVLSVLSDVLTMDSNCDEAIKNMFEYCYSHFVQSLEKMEGSLVRYREFVDHVIDTSRLPDLVISATHDSSLQDIAEERLSVENDARALMAKANSSWASFTDVKLESSPQHGFYFRTTKGDDERQMRTNNPKVQILSLQKNGLHFTTPSLMSLSASYQNLDAQYRKLQLDLVRNAVTVARSYLPLLENACSVIAELDVLLSFATVAALSASTYCRPTLHPLGSASRHISLSNARHPCMELLEDLNDGFIPNSYDLEEKTSSFQIITGPNMGGKSTYIRTLGCIVVMAQVGSFVPCDAAEISVVDCILARVGAGDIGQKGVSTFMAEMLEASVLLETATSNSLILIDELGRGTSTFDGYGLAWAISEYIVTRVNAFCMFATHFHELTAMSASHTAVVNKHVTAHTEGDQVVMLHRVLPGPCAESFGVQVAAMADFPNAVIEEAKRKADELETMEEKGCGDGTDETAVKRRKLVSAAMQEFASLPLDTMPAAGIKASLIKVMNSAK